MTNKRTTMAIIFAIIVVVVVIILFIISAASNIDKRDKEIKDSPEVATDYESGEEFEGIFEDGLFGGFFNFLIFIVIGYFLWNKVIKNIW